MPVERIGSSIWMSATPAASSARASTSRAAAMSGTSSSLLRYIGVLIWSPWASVVGPVMIPFTFGAFEIAYFVSADRDRPGSGLDLADHFLFADAREMGCKGPDHVPPYLAVRDDIDPGRDLVADRSLDRGAERVKEAHEAPAFYDRVTAHDRCRQYLIDKICFCHGCPDTVCYIQVDASKRNSSWSGDEPVHVAGEEHGFPHV